MIKFKKKISKKTNTIVMGKIWREKKEKGQGVLA